MEEKLDVSAQMNIIAPMFILDICDQLPNMTAFVHVSTAYCHAERYVVEETVYPLPRPLDDMVENCLNGGQLTQAEVKRFISPKPNTYVFTKTLAETVVKKHGYRGYPVAIFRPAIVSTSLRDPFTGWVQDYNGPIGTTVATLKGVMRVVNCNEDLRADFLPVDICANTLITVAWEVVIDNPSDLRVYNCSTGDNPTTWRELRENILEEIRENPIPSIMWYPSLYMITNRYVFKVAALFLETIPLYFIELFMRIFGKNKKRLNLIKVNKRLVGMRNALEHCSTHEYWYTTNNVRRLRARLTQADAAIYNIEPTSICWKDYFKSYARGIKRHLIGDKEAGTPKAKKHLER
ncbi:unnamed protein product [Diatraea saccharalis]|uniref:Fatty acyl-CoA reductase n=1 Tax=Diatraea saccharalis TaxID=40085 RepID=A0A9N9R6G5_9NEOP|nr:unnamed protein product [Diatraea saccharalis]